MLDLVFSQNQQGSSFKLFKELFHQEISTVTEYSFGLTTERFGTCILGGASSDFLNRVFQFASYSSLICDQTFKAVQALSQTNPQDYGLKIDWHHNSAAQLTLYSRYKAPLPSREYHQLACALGFDRWKGLSLFDLVELLGCEYPFCFSIRKSALDTLKCGGYVEVCLPTSDFQSKLDPISKSFGWRKETTKLIQNDLQLVAPHEFRGCIGLESTGQTLKLDFAGLGLPRIASFLKRAEFPTNTIQRLLQVAKTLNQLQSNYFALKYNLEGQRDWKVYFAVLSSDLS